MDYLRVNRRGEPFRSLTGGHADDAGEGGRTVHAAERRCGRIRMHDSGQRAAVAARDRGPHAFGQRGPGLLLRPAHLGRDSPSLAGFRRCHQGCSGRFRHSRHGGRGRLDRRGLPAGRRRFPRGRLSGRRHRGRLRRQARLAAELLLAGHKRGLGRTRRAAHRRICPGWQQPVETHRVPPRPAQHVGRDPQRGHQ